MIASLTGTVKAIRPQSIVVEVGGVGILVSVSPRVAGAHVVGTSISLHTVLVVREDALTLYGFETASARDLFELLQTVTGIGPKVAQSALTVYDTTQLANAIKSENDAALERIPGLGKKGAQRLVLELKDKVDGFAHGVDFPMGANNWRDQLTSALLGLGFTAREAQERIDRVATQFTDHADQPIAELLRAVLAGGVIG
ncbi:MAG: Holliday junction branch migration protein RuvA [Actinomycetota bacterium]